MHTHSVSGSEHVINQKSLYIYDDYGFRIDPLKEEDLEEGEVLCDICKGHGYITNEIWGRIVCRKCQGLAKLDWIERIVGKKEPEFVSGYSGCTAYSSGSYGVSTYATYASGIPNSELYQVPKNYSINQQRLISATTNHNSLIRKLKAYGRTLWKTIETENTISNKLMCGLKKLIWGVE